MSNHNVGLAERRKAFLVELLDVVGADAGWWSWGRGRPDVNTIVPVAQIQSGFSPEQLASMVEYALDHEAIRDFHLKIWRQMHGASQIATLRREIFTDAEWEASKMRSVVAKAGLDAWVHCVRYSTHDTWSNFFLVRNAGPPGFSEEDPAALDLAMGPCARSPAGREGGSAHR